MCTVFPRQSAPILEESCTSYFGSVSWSDISLIDLCFAELSCYHLCWGYWRILRQKWELLQRAKYLHLAGSWASTRYLISSFHRYVEDAESATQSQNLSREISLSASQHPNTMTYQFLTRSGLRLRDHLSFRDCYLAGVFFPLDSLSCSLKQNMSIEAISSSLPKASE